MIYTKTKLPAFLYRYADGLYRLAAYVPGLPDWKSVARQIVVTEEQALAAVKRGELYVAINRGGRRSLIHSRYLEVV